MNQPKQYTLAQYKEMSERFNKMDFHQKILTIHKNSDILTLASDGNWWGVRVKDKEIQAELDDSDIAFGIENEWGTNEMCILVSLLGIGNIDY